MEKISFSLRAAFRESWELFKKNAVFFVVTTLLLFIFKMANSSNHPTIMSLVSPIASLILYLVLLKSALALAKDTSSKLEFKQFATFLPSFREFFGTIAVSIISGAIALIGGAMMIGGAIFGMWSIQAAVAITVTAIGGIIFVIGLYFALRLLLANYFFIADGLKIKDALRTAWHVTKNASVANKTIIVLVCAGLFSALGIIVFGIDVLVTYPVGLIVIAKYFYVVKRFATTTVAPQPVELPPVQG